MDRQARQRIEALADKLNADAGRRASFATGTHRVLSPEQTLSLVSPVMRRAGITRVAGIGGLDRIGVPVYAAYRPDARTIVVSQGKGVTAEAARVSAVMESLELWHSELHLVPVITGSWSRLRRSVRVVDVAYLQRYAPAVPDAHRRSRWTPGLELLSGESILVPYEVVHNDDRVPAHPTDGVFKAGTNGLASGNTVIEAVLHALYEIVERDAAAHDLTGKRPGRRMDLATVTDPSCMELMTRFAGAGIELRVWDLTGPHEIPVYQAVGIEVDPPWYRPLPQAWGCGAHRDPGIALSRAITEVAQVRATLISGCRDDLMRADYVSYYDPRTRSGEDEQTLTQQGVPVPWGRHPARPEGTLGDDLAWLLERLKANGSNEIAVVDLSQPWSGIAVVKAVVPGMWWC